MPRVKLNQPINNDGTITTCAELLDAGLAFVEQVDNFHSPRSKSGSVTKYFCNLGDDPMSGWEIGKKAYQSRAAKGQDVNPMIEQAEASQTRMPRDEQVFDAVYNLLSNIQEHDVPMLNFIRKEWAGVSDWNHKLTIAMDCLDTPPPYMPSHIWYAAYKLID